MILLLPFVHEHATAEQNRHVYINGIPAKVTENFAKFYLKAAQVYGLFFFAIGGAFFFYLDATKWVRLVLLIVGMVLRFAVVLLTSAVFRFHTVLS